MAYDIKPATKVDKLNEINGVLGHLCAHIG